MTSVTPLETSVKPSPGGSGSKVAIAWAQEVISGRTCPSAGSVPRWARLAAVGDGPLFDTVNRVPVTSGNRKSKQSFIGRCVA